MSYIGNLPTTGAFPFDQFTGNGTTTSFTLTYAPAGTTSIIVAISGVVQNPNNYSVIGQTLAFSPAPPAGANNISVLYLGLPVIGATLPGNTAFLSSTDLTATAGQKIFASAGAYTPGFVQVYRNGSRLGAADYVATNGTTVTLAIACAAGDLVAIEYYTLNALVNALPMTGGVVTGSTTFNSDVIINGALASGVTGFKNRIINGDMRIDQRNGGASGTAANYTVDRWEYAASQAAKGTWQQNAGGVLPPAGFTKYWGFTSSSAYAAGVNDYFIVRQAIEANNMLDFGWGGSSSIAATVSFWVRSSLTGTFGGSLDNGNDRGFPFTYTIGTANTWEYKTVGISAPAAGGTWGVGNGSGVFVSLSFGTGTTYSGTPSSWNTGRFLSANGTTSVVATAGATFYITGVQLEKGSNATSFEYRDYGRELAMCQRYYQTISYSACVGAANPLNGATVVTFDILLPVSLRATPTVSSSLTSLFTATGSQVSSAAFVPSIQSMGANTVTLLFTGKTLAANTVYWALFGPSFLAAEL